MKDFKDGGGKENQFIRRFVQLVGDLQITTQIDDGQKEQITEIVDFFKEKFSMEFKKVVPMTIMKKDKSEIEEEPSKKTDLSVS